MGGPVIYKGKCECDNVCRISYQLSVSVSLELLFFPVPPIFGIRTKHLLQGWDHHCPAPLTLVPPAGGDSSSAGEHGRWGRGGKVRCCFSYLLNRILGAKKAICSLPPKHAGINADTRLRPHWNVLVKSVALESHYLIQTLLYHLPTG